MLALCASRSPTVCTIIRPLSCSLLNAVIDRLKGVIITPGTPAAAVNIPICKKYGRQDVEAITHVLSVSASGLETLESERDSVTINGEAYLIANHTDDGRAMIKLHLKGEI